MRTTKFRAWDGKKFHYTPDFNLHFGKDGIIAGLNNGGMVFNKTNEIQQFTGLQDKNGKDIYEGDIHLMNNKPWVITIPNIFYRIESDMNCLTETNIEVIGNIHENPELL